MVSVNIADDKTLNAANSPRSRKASDLSTSRHRNAEAVVMLLVIIGAEISLITVLTDPLYCRCDRKCNA